MIYLLIMKNFLTLSILLLPFFLLCQEEEEGLVIIQDEKIESLVKKRATSKATHKVVSSEGFRLQLVYNTKKDDVNKERIKFIKKFPKIETYVQYDAPLFFLRVGDFKEKEDAEKFSKDLLKIYPEHFIYKTSINLPFELEKKDTLNSKKKKNKKEIKKKSKEIKKNSTPKK
jgi:hypothetical protein